MDQKQCRPALLALRSGQISRNRVLFDSQPPLDNLHWSDQGLKGLNVLFQSLRQPALLPLQALRQAVAELAKESLDVRDLRLPGFPVEFQQFTNIARRELQALK